MRSHPGASAPAAVTNWPCSGSTGPRRIGRNYIHKPSTTGDGGRERGGRGEAAEVEVKDEVGEACHVEAPGGRDEVVHPPP